MRLSACAIVIAGCAQAQMPSNVGGDGIDRSAATEVLGSIERTACSEAAGPRGTVQLTVIFATDGNVTDAKLDRGGESPRGTCLLERLRELHVPPFKGAPTKVARKLTLE